MKYPVPLCLHGLERVEFAARIWSDRKIARMMQVCCLRGCLNEGAVFLCGRRERQYS
jgi:hypothetical protein